MTDGDSLCRACGAVVPVPCTAPPEPPIGAWVRDRFGALSRRTAEGWGLPGFMPFGVWAAMWHARGPLTECGEWGHDAASEARTNPGQSADTTDSVVEGVG